MPYTLVREAGGPSRPATFVDYTGATVLQALVRLLRDGHDVTRMSIDTLAASDVTGAKAEAGLPVSRVRVLPYRPGRARHRRGLRIGPGSAPRRRRRWAAPSRGTPAVGT